MQLFRENPILSQFVTILNTVASFALLLAVCACSLGNDRNIPSAFTIPLVFCHGTATLTLGPLTWFSSRLSGTVLRFAFAVRRLVLMAGYLFALLIFVYDVPGYIVASLIIPHLLGDFLLGLIDIRGKERMVHDSLLVEVRSQAELMVKWHRLVKELLDRTTQAHNDGTCPCANPRVVSPDTENVRAGLGGSKFEGTETMQEKGDVGGTNIDLQSATLEEEARLFSLIMPWNGE